MIPDNEFWRLNKSTDVETIEWTPQKGGIVRAKSDSRSEWLYKKCHNAKNAESTGWQLILMQREVA